MRIVIINTDYGPFLRDLYGTHASLARQSYDAQMRQRNETLFGSADFYSRHLIARGHQAAEVHANNGPMQIAWLRSQGREPLFKRPQAERGLQRLYRGVARRFFPTALRPPRPSHLRSPIEPLDTDVEEILVEQIKALRPDVVLNHAVSEIESRILKRMRPYTKLIAGQIASPLPEDESYSAYDLMVSSLPNFVRYFRNRRIPAELNLLAFEPSVLDAVGTVERDIPVSFAGSVTSDHGGRFDMLERLAAESELAIWGRLHAIPEGSPIWRKYRGEAWGRDMYRVLARSKITINRHIDIAENYANNLRLFEATGMGAMLITDWKDNIAELFEPGKEVVCYRSTEECIELIKYYSTNDAERVKIAAAGQQRTLRDHTYRIRMTELAQILADRLAQLTT